MAQALYLRNWSEKVKLNFMILSKYVLSLMVIGIPLDIIRFINILYLQCVDEEICEKIYPCKSLYCSWLFIKQSKQRKKTCNNFLHKKCILVHCQEVKCHKILCLNRFQKSWEDFTQDGFREDHCKCRRVFCDTCYIQRDQGSKCFMNLCYLHDKR